MGYQVDELYNPAPGESEQESRAAYYRKVNNLQREEFLYNQRSRASVNVKNLGQNDNNSVWYERFPN